MEDRYELEEVLASRASGATYRAIDRRSGERVVVKELLLRQTKDLKEVELFEREAELLARIDHPQVPAILAYFEVQRPKTVGLYIVQELIDGTSMEQELADHRFTAAEVAEVLAEMCDVLAYLRTLDPPVVHRDIKPANILRTETGLVLVDFGAARAAADSVHHAGSTIAGTFGYMAPEQLTGSATPASDVFGLGATALRLLTGRHPGELVGEGSRFNWNRDDFAPGLAALIDTMTAPDANDRPRDLAGLSRELRQFAAGQSALKRYRSSLPAVGDVPRPSAMVPWRETPKHARSLLAFLALVTPVLMFVIHATKDPVSARAASGAAGLILGSVVSALSVAGYVIKYLVERAMRSRLIRFGRCVRGIVEGREVLPLHASVVVRFDDRGSQIAKIPVDEALDIDVGEEVVVCVDERNPARFTIVALESRP